MNFKIFLTIFTTIFLAELGDKTQLATMLFATNNNHSKWIIFFASALALIISSAFAVLIGSFISKYINPKMLSNVAGIGFIIIGIWTIIK